MKELIKEKKLLLAIILILIIQIGIRIYVGNEKHYFHMDEGYSYGLIQYDKIDITNNEDFYDTWHTSEYFKDYFSISKEEAWDFTPVYENQKNDVHPPLYYLLLRIASSFTIDSFSKWTGILLNLLIFIPSSILVYLIAQRLFKNSNYALLVTFISGLTIASLETTILIRMYALTALNLLIITYLHMKYYSKEELSFKNLTIFSIFIILGSLTHYYYLVFLGILYLLYLFHYSKHKQWKNALKYTGMMIFSAIISLAIFPYSFVHMFMGYRGQGAMENLTKIENIWKTLGQYLGILNHSTFNGILIFLVVIVLLIVTIKLIKNKKLTITIQNTEIGIIAIPTLFYFMLIAIVSPYQELRYIMPICPLMVIIVMYFLKTVLQKIQSEKNTFLLMLGFVIIMLFIPILGNFRMDYQYKNWDTVVQEFKATSKLPTIYIIKKGQQRFMDDIYLFTLIDNSYLLDSEKKEEQQIKQIFENIDTSEGVTVFVNDGLEHIDYLEKIKKATSLNQIEFIRRMNSCYLYRITP